MSIRCYTLRGGALLLQQRADLVCPSRPEAAYVGTSHFQMQILLPSSNVCFSPHDPFVRSEDILRLSLCLTGAQSLLHAVTFPWAAVPWDVGRGSSAPGGGEGPGHSYILWGTFAIDKSAEAKLRLYYDVVSPCLEL